eukprot:CAMPEP_0167776020 /NCGR_PEP_ID=MMETSP0111_2-20121227/2893_1 /TAXON_ID=91324 /ORGANISM="Lotharella globosa, Strain CCCM811" /LENGTH=186 /DNA_ID=CAMNT_0007666021 /DNA_START=49 /DNA_END=606 /DNA_ORIENTATION=+
MRPPPQPHACLRAVGGVPLTKAMRDWMGVEARKARDSVAGSVSGVKMYVERRGVDSIPSGVIEFRAGHEPVVRVSGLLPIDARRQLANVTLKPYYSIIKQRLLATSLTKAQMEKMGWDARFGALRVAAADPGHELGGLALGQIAKQADNLGEMFKTVKNVSSSLRSLAPALREEDELDEQNNAHRR